MKSFKNRKIKLDKPVKVYRNLNNKNFKYSIMQNGLVVAHSNKISLAVCSFIVRESGRQKVIKNNRKFVHAFIVGHICDLNRKELDYSDKVSYNPYKDSSFMIGGETNIYSSPFVFFEENGVWAGGCQVQVFSIENRFYV